MLSLLNLETALAWWGAILFTALVAVSIWEFSRGRFRVNVEACFAGSPHIGNEVYIRNLSPNPILLRRWKMLRRGEEDAIIASMECGNEGYSISPSAVHTLKFRGEHHFLTSHKSLEGYSVYIVLDFAGRKPLLRKLYPSFN